MWQPPQQQASPGWYHDPSGEYQFRFWNGREWTVATDKIPVQQNWKGWLIAGVVTFVALAYFLADMGWL